MQTIINRGIANTRLRDFYDVYSIMNFYEEQIEAGFYTMHFLLPQKRGKLFFTKDDIEAIAFDILTICTWQSFGGSFRKAILCRGPRVEKCD